MAKGLRASSERSNRRKLRANVFGPVEKARADRLHAKLLATINSAKPAPPQKPSKSAKSTKPTQSTSDDEDEEEEDEAPAEEASKDMDVDDKPATKKPHTNQKDQKTKNQRARKPRNSIAFPSSRGKGALKPFTGKARVSKRK